MYIASFRAFNITSQTTGIPAHVTSLHTLLYKYPKAGNSFTVIITYKEMFLGCDWLIRVQLIPNITQNSAKICNTVQKSVTTVQKSVTTVQKSVTTVQKDVTTVQKSVISSLSDGIYSLKNQKYGGRIFTFA